MMLSARNSSSSSSKYPFTETQWQELEHQALIFKYMISGIPIPPDLIYTVQKSLLSSHYSHQPGGWGCYGRKADPEPGRCRRTDGKKWRCSKEAFPDSKYCERHMHRTKNRSRKPVESSSAAPTTSTSSSVLSLSSPSSSSVVTDHHNSTHPYFNTITAASVTPSSMYPYSSRNTAHLSSPNNTSSHDMISNYSDKDYRYFLPEASADSTLKSFPESYTPFGGYPSSQLLQPHDDDDESPHHVATSKQQMHHFFSEKWPQKGDSWMSDVEDHHDNPSSSFSTTQLSMSLPMSSNHNLFAPNSRLHNGG